MRGTQRSSAKDKSEGEELTKASEERKLAFDQMQVICKYRAMNLPFGKWRGVLVQWPSVDDANGRRRT